MWRSIAAVVACHVLLIISDASRLQFVVTDNYSINFGTEQVDQFHDCLCSDKNYQCNVISFNDVTVDVRGRNNNSVVPYINFYECEFIFKDAFHINCIRKTNTSVCEKGTNCTSLCFAKRTSCDLESVGVKIAFPENIPVVIHNPDTVEDRSCPSLQPNSETSVTPARLLLIVSIAVCCAYSLFY